MKVKCRGFEGELLRLEKCVVFNEINGMMNIGGYSVKMSNDIGRIIEIQGVEESEIEIETGVSLRLDASALVTALNRPFIRSDTDGKPEIDRRCCCAD